MASSDLIWQWRPMLVLPFPNYLTHVTLRQIRYVDKLPIEMCDKYLNVTSDVLNRNLLINFEFVNTC